MLAFLVGVTDKLASKLSPRFDSSHNKTNDKVLYHSNGSVSINLENKEVQKTIKEQLENIAQIKTTKSNHA